MPVPAVYRATSRSFTYASSLPGGSSAALGARPTMLWTMAMMTAAGVLWPDTSALRIPHRPPGSSMKS